MTLPPEIVLPTCALSFFLLWKCTGSLRAGEKYMRDSETPWFISYLVTWVILMIFTIMESIK